MSRIYPVMPTEFLGRDYLDNNFPMRVTAYEVENDIMICELAGTVWTCHISAHYREFVNAINILISRDELYAMVNLDNWRTWFWDMHKAPSEIGCNAGRILDLGTLMPNSKVGETTRRMAIWANRSKDNQMECLAPIVRVDRPLGKFQPDGQGEITYQVVFPGSIVVIAEPGQNLHTMRVVNGDGVDIKSNPLHYMTHYHPVSIYYDWLIRNKPEWDEITSLIRASHLLWNDASRADNIETREDREEIRGTNADAREAMDTPTSIESRFLKRVYNVAVPDESINRIECEVYKPNEFARELKSLGKRKRRYDLLYYNHRSGAWEELEGGVTKKSAERLLKERRYWQTPHFLLLDTRRDGSYQIEIMCLRINPKRIDVENEVDLNAYAGRMEFVSRMGTNDADHYERKLISVMKEMYPRGEIQFALVHECSKYRGKKHLISRVTWTNKWFYHGWFWDRAPMTEELYNIACQSLYGYFQNIYPKRTVVCTVLPEDDWRPKIPLNMRTEMQATGFPVIEIVTKKRHDRNEYD